MRAETKNKMTKRKGELVRMLTAAGWLGGIAVGWFGLVAYSTQPGPIADPPPSWPAESAIPRTAGKPTLVMFAHPRCPCTRATIEELARIMAVSQGAARVYVCMYLPDADAGWGRTDLWESAATIPGVTVLPDVAGAEARRFGATTSGHVALYDAHGDLIYSGGITPARGHAGDNKGAGAVRGGLKGLISSVSRMPTYGCALVDEFGAGPECAK